MWNIRSMVLVLGSMLAAIAVQAAAPQEFEPLAFLLGAWEASESGTPGEATGATTFSLDLQDRVMVRRNFAEYPASSRGAASRHDDLMVIYVGAGKRVEASFFDSEGHVIHYAVASGPPGTVSFVSDIVDGAPRFRLNYTLNSDGILEGEFAIAPPGQPETFSQYLKWESHRLPPAAGETP